jgi:hypothetical protein
MKSAEVEVGKVYAVRVSGKIARVRLLSEIDAHWKRGRHFVGLNMATGRQIRVSAARCRHEVVLI